MITSREYRYLSPVIAHLKGSGKVTLLKGAGLVHSPDLHLTALAEEDADRAQPSLAERVLAVALDLKPDATNADVHALLIRIRDMVGEPEGADQPAQLCEVTEPDPARFVSTDTLPAVLTERNEVQAILREQRAHARVDDAFARGYLSPAMRDLALALCQSDEASFDRLITQSVPQFAHPRKPATTSAMPPMPQPQHHSAEASAICEQLGLPPGTLSV